MRVGTAMWALASLQDSYLVDPASSHMLVSTVVILELIHAKNPDCLEGMYLLDKKSMLFELFDDS